MTNEEILDAFCKSRGLTRTKGATPEPLLPFMMMDCVFQMYCKWVAKLDLKHECKRYRSEWKKAYSDMNRAFFRAFNEEQTDAVIDMMDDFDKYIHNDLVIAKVAIIDCLDDGRTLDEQQVASSCILSEVLCWSAMVVWDNVFKATRQMDVHEHIDRIRKSIHRFINAWYRPEKHVNVADDPKCEAAITALCHKMIRYLVVDYRRRKEQADIDSNKAV